MATKSIRLTDGTDTLLPESATSSSYTGVSGTGYSKMADGTLIQWGTLNNQTADDVTITFPIAFYTFPTVVASTGAGGARTPIYVEDLNLQQFLIHRQTSGSSIWLRWVAIGRWK